MQNIIMYVSAAEMVGEVKDFAGAQPATPPTFMIGVEALLKMRLFAESEGDRAYPIDELNQLSGWRFVMDSDFDSATPVKLEADNANIQLATVTDEAGGSSRSYTEVAIPMPNMNTVELAEYLAAQEQVTLTGELTGYDANGAVVFCVQVKNFTVRNRITASGTPTNVEDEYLTAAQVQAIINAATQVIEVALPPEEINSEGVWEQTFADLGITGRRVVQLINSDGMICTEDALILINWTDTGLRVDFGSNIPDSAYTLIM